MISKNIYKLIRSLELKKNRKKEGLFVAEGPKVVADLMEFLLPRIIVATDTWYAVNGYKSDAYNLVATEEELRNLSFLQHPQQVLAVFPLPNYNICINTCNKELCLGLDGIQDPGNLGTIIRIADWFGISTIYCGKGTVDAYSPKVVQSSMGSIARVKTVYLDLVDLIKHLPMSTPVYATSLDGDNIYSSKLAPKGLIIMGNEGNGVSKEILNSTNLHLCIPKHNEDSNIDSLNVAIATAVICAEFKRRKIN